MLSVQNLSTDQLVHTTWLVIPLYNEQTVIADVIQDALRTFPHIVCVDDGSNDDSAARAQAAGAVVIHHPINLGQGAALQTGISWVLTYTDAHYIVTFDADGQHRASDALRMVQRAQHEHLSYVLGSRFLNGNHQTGCLKHIVLTVAAKVTRWRTGMALTDSHNGLRVLRRDAASALNLTQSRMAHASQIVSQLAATQLPWAEEAVTIDYTEYSRSKGQSLLNGVNILTEMIFAPKHH
ncbi:MAG: glycosyltransferase family 2 protein [Actinomycetaceae bacterium]|nr:glycosyltransferase family 2 protein [Actinomycetaceae bacterium]MDY5273905.1 glycosyltransferase family 2 protein [Arcanobacterium sp.]